MNVTNFYRFRWVVLQIDNLRKCHSPRDVKVALKSLPRTLEETYHRILAGVDFKDQQGCRNMLHLLSISSMLLTVDEVAELFIVDIDRDSVEVDARFMEPSAILDICPGLIEKTAGPEYTRKMNIPSGVELSDWLEQNRIEQSRLEQSSQITAHIQPQYVKLTHSSVLDFLMSSQIRKTGVALFGFNIESASFLAAKLCLLYLIAYNLYSSEAQNGPTGGHGLWKVQSEAVIGWPLLPYASKTWLKHMIGLEPLTSGDINIAIDSNQSKKRHVEILNSLALQLFNREATSCLKWSSTALEQGVLKDKLPSLQGLPEGLDDILFSRDCSLKPPLGELPAACLSSAMSDCEPIFLHLRLTAQTRPGILSTKPRLSELVSAEEGSILRLIYEGITGKSLSRYIGSREIELSRFLNYALGLGFEDPGSLALVSSAAQGNVRLVDLLLQLGVDVDAPNKSNAALCEAADSDPPCYEVIELLLKRGANPNKARGLQWHSNVSSEAVLVHAAAENHTRLVDMLILHGADVNLVSGSEGSALHTAASAFHFTHYPNQWRPPSTMQQLIKNGARVFPRRSGYEDFLRYTDSNAVSRHLRVLKEAGAEQEDSEGVRPLDCLMIWRQHKALRRIERQNMTSYDIEYDEPEGPKELKWLCDECTEVDKKVTDSSLENEYECLE